MCGRRCIARPPGGKHAAFVIADDGQPAGTTRGDQTATLIEPWPSPWLSSFYHRFYRQQFATQAAGLLTQSSAVELGLGGSGLRVVESSLVTTTKTMASRLLIAAGGAACIDTLSIRFLVFLGGWGASVGDAQ